MSIRKFFKSIKKNIEMDHPKLLIYLLMVQRKRIAPVCDWTQEELSKGVMECYKRHMGYAFDINKPVLFTEKLQWYKVFYRRPDMERITDKYLFKLYINERLGEGFTIPVYKSWTDVDTLEKDWDLLPEEFVLKANLQSDGRNIMVVHKKSSIKFKRIKRKLKTWFDVRDTLANSYDCNTYCGTPRILAEEYMANFEDQLFDYKFFCFDGKPFCVYVAQDHFGKEGSHISFYDLDWNKMDVKYGNHIVGDAPKPKHYDEMVEIAEKLSVGFPFIRVDFFDTDEKLFVAEMTFNPGGGVTKYHPDSFNKKMGDLFKLPIEYNG